MNKNKYKKISQFSMSGKFLMEWNDVHQIVSTVPGMNMAVYAYKACKTYNPHTHSVRLTAAGYAWVYSDELVSKDPIIVDVSRAKPVVRFDRNGIYIDRYESIKKAATTLGISATGIYNSATTYNGSTCAYSTRVGMFVYEFELEGKTKLDKYTRGREVAQFTKAGEFVAVYKSINDASEVTGASANSIAYSVRSYIRPSYLNGSSRLAGNYQWAYVRDLNLKGEERVEDIKIAPWSRNVVNAYVRQGTLPAAELDAFKRNVAKTRGITQQVKIVQYDFQGNFIKLWSCAQEAAASNAGWMRMTISMAASQGGKLDRPFTAYGYQWRKVRPDGTYDLQIARHIKDKYGEQYGRKVLQCENRECSGKVIEHVSVKEAARGVGGWIAQSIYSGMSKGHKTYGYYWKFKNTPGPIVQVPRKPKK